MKTKNLIPLATMLIMLLTSLNLMAQQPQLQYFRAYDQSAVNIFEPAKDDQTPFDGLKVRVGGSFAQQFQSITHSNTADTSLPNLLNIGSGFNTATANLNIDVQLADGVTLSLITYLSSRHHVEAWVKGGYMQIDKAEFLNSDFVNRLMENMRIKVGHMQINYGDQQFRRTDNGNAMYNPFVGNYIMDAFTTEIGAEVYYFTGPFTIMYGMTNGLIKGDNLNPDQRSPAVLGKIAFDKNFSDDFRFRLAASVYNSAQAGRSTLFGGDRTGSRYYGVMEVAATTAEAFSGRYNPNFAKQVTATQYNMFLKFKGLESFTTYEYAFGKGNADPVARTATQFATELIYRFLDDEKLFVGGRYNMVTATPFANAPTDINISRIQAGLGWFVTPNILTKVEYVNQDYQNFNAFDLRSGGNFNGIMIEGVIGF